MPVVGSFSDGSARRGPKVATVFAILAVLSLAFASTAAAQTKGDDSSKTIGKTGPKQVDGERASVRERVTFMLSGYHFSPSREKFDEAFEPAEATEALREIASDDDVRPSLRSRAVDTLGFYDDDKTVSFLKGLLDGADEDAPKKEKRVAGVLRHHAIISLARNHTDSQAVSLLDGLLEDDNLQIRLTVIAALGEHAGEPGEKALVDFADSAEDEIVRDELSKYVDLE